MCVQKKKSSYVYIIKNLYLLSKKSKLLIRSANSTITLIKKFFSFFFFGGGWGDRRGGYLNLVSAVVCAEVNVTLGTRIRFSLVLLINLIHNLLDSSSLFTCFFFFKCWKTVIIKQNISDRLLKHWDVILLHSAKWCLKKNEE